MSDTDDIVFSDPEQGPDDFEVAVLKEGEAPPGPEAEKPDVTKVTLTADEYAALQARIDSNAALTQGLAKFTDKLGQPQMAPANVPQGPDSYDPVALEADLFATGKSVGTIEKIMERKLAGMQGQLLQNMIVQNKQMLQLNPKTAELYKAYEPEIEKRISMLPINIRMQPNIYEQMYRQVVMDNQEEIIEKRVKSRMETSAQEAITKQAEELKAKRQPLYNEQGGGAVKPPVPKVYLTSRDVQIMRESMLDPQDKDHVRVYLARKKELGGK